MSFAPLIRSDNSDSSVWLHYDVPAEGKYYMLLAFCDSSTANLNVTGHVVAMNPYGHFPARLYGLIPFTRWLCFLSAASLVVWLYRCNTYRKELMSVHGMITAVLVVFIVDSLLKLWNINTFNKKGVYTMYITIISLVFDSITRVVGRCLTLMVTMGYRWTERVIRRLGVTCSSLGNTMWKIVGMGCVYFVLSLWDSLVSTFSTSTSVNLLHVIPSSLMDSVIYFWILQSLLDTIEALEEKKQTSKLHIFIKLRNMIIVIVIFATLYNIFFSYIIIKKALDFFWKYQWFFNDGVWSLFYYLILCSIMVLFLAVTHV